MTINDSMTTDDFERINEQTRELYIKLEDRLKKTKQRGMIKANCDQYDQYDKSFDELVLLYEKCTYASGIGHLIEEYSSYLLELIKYNKDIQKGLIEGEVPAFFDFVFKFSDKVEPKINRQTETYKKDKELYNLIRHKEYDERCIKGQSKSKVIKCS